MEERFARTEALLGAGATEKLQKAHVAVVGIGGVGSWCAEALCRSGVGQLTLMDFDTVAPSNLNRQAQALCSTLGQLKTEALAARLRDIAPGIKLRLLPLRCDGEGQELLFAERPDYVADCIDSVGDKCQLIVRCVAQEIPIISSMGTGGKTDAGQLQLGDLAKTNTDGLARAMRRELKKQGIFHLPVVWSPELPQTGPEGKPGTVMWVPAAAGMRMAQKIVLDLIG